MSNIFFTVGYLGTFISIYCGRNTFLTILFICITVISLVTSISNECKLKDRVRLLEEKINVIYTLRGDKICKHSEQD